MNAKLTRKQKVASRKAEIEADGNKVRTFLRIAELIEAGYLPPLPISQEVIRLNRKS